jgi:WD40 repeat protein
VTGGSVAGSVPYGSLKNKNSEYKWWFVLWRLPNFIFDARGIFLGGKRDEFVEWAARARAVLGVGALAYVTYAYPGYLRGVPEVYSTSGRLWPGVGTLLRFATIWQTSIVSAIVLSAIWIGLFALLMLLIARPRALPGLLLHLCWPVATITVFAGQAFLIVKAISWGNNYFNSVGTPSAVVSFGILAATIIVAIWVIKSVYLAATDVFRGDDAHPLLAPFVTTGVSWTLAYLALSSGGQSAAPHSIRLLTTLAGPLTVTLINVVACLRIRRDNGGRLLFLDGPPGGSGYSAAPAGSAFGWSRRELLRLAVPPAIVVAASPWWAPKALALGTTRSNQILAYLTDTGTDTNLEVSEAVVTSVTFSHDGRTLASGTTEGTVQLWDVADPARPTALGHPLTARSEISSVAFSPDGRTLATGRGDATIQLWNVTHPARPTALGRPLTAPNEVSSVAFSPDGRTLAATSNYSDGLDGTAPGTIQLWDVTDPARPRALSSSGSAAEEGYSSVAFSPRGRILAGGSMIGVVQLWDVTDLAHPSVVSSLRTSADEGYTFAVFSPDGRILAGGNSDGAVYLWDVADPGRPTALGHPLSIPDEVSSVAFSPDGRTLAASSNRGWSSLGPFDGTGAICAWNISDPARPTGPTQFPTAPVPGFSSVAFSPNGRTLASGSDAGPNGNGPGSVQLWDVASLARPTALGHPL